MQLFWTQWLSGKFIVDISCTLVSSGTQVQPQIILDPDYLPDYLSVSYNYGLICF